MEDFLLSLMQWAAGHPDLVGALVGLIACAESLAFVGLMFPGAAMMLGTGALIGVGVVDFWSVYLWSVAGAVLGDGLSYWLGHTHKDRLLRLRFVQSRPHLLAGGEAFFTRHGGKSVLLARFVGPVRPVLPLVAGMLGMPPQRFYFYNVFSALLWAPAYLLPGMAFGASLALAGQVAGLLALFLAVLLVVFWLLVWAVRLLYQTLQPQVRGLLLWFAVAVFAAALVWHLPRLFVALNAAHSPPKSVAVLNAWPEQGWRQLPAYRLDPVGQEKQPLNLQWAGDLASLDRALHAAGWRAPLPLSPRNALRWLLPHPTLDDLPTVPQQHAGHDPALVRVHAGAAARPGQRLILRLWPSGWRDADSGALIWLGSVTWQHIETLPLLHYARDAGGYDEALEMLRQGLQVPEIERVQREVNGDGRGWRGGALIVGARTKP